MSMDIEDGYYAPVDQPTSYENDSPASKPSVQPGAAAKEPVASRLNPFGGGEAIPTEESRLSGISEGALGVIGIVKPENEPTKVEADQSSLAVAKQVAGAIAEMYIKGNDKESVRFPKNDDMSVIGLSFKELENTPLSLGYGAFPESVRDAWNQFINETTTNYRRSHNLQPVDLVPLELDVPEWLNQNTSFDFLGKCELMDIVINGDVNFLLAQGARYCRVTVNGNVAHKAKIGDGSWRSSFIINGGLELNYAFREASNVSIQLRGGSGTIGPLNESKVTASGKWTGTVSSRDNVTIVSQGVTLNRV